MTGSLHVLRDDGAGPQLLIAVGADGRITAYNGHVDLGTGIGTALAQIVAEEMDVPLGHVTVELGHTATVLDQGPTIASETIQVAALPLRHAAATARAFLLARAAAWLEAPVGDLVVADGCIARRDRNRQFGFGALVAGQHDRVLLDPAAPLKPPAAYAVVGQPAPRLDIPAKAAGTFTYVHDVRVPGMAHGRVVRPPYAGMDVGAFVGRSLVAVDHGSVRDLPGLVAVVVIGDFVGVVAEREEQAIEAAGRLAVTWRPHATLPDLNQPEQALRANASTPRVLVDRGGVDAALAAAAPLNRTYVWPYQMHASIGPSCAVADYRDGGLTVWSGTQNPHPLRDDLAQLLDLPADRIDVIRHEAAGCYGRNGADDVSADAALLSRAAERPVRVQLSREQEHAWEPKGAAQVMDVAGGLDATGGVAGYDFATRFPSNAAPTLALLLTGVVPPVPAVLTMGDRTAAPPYAYPAIRVTVHDMAPIVRASWLRGVSAVPNSFAHESWIDEAAAAAGADPVEYRLRQLADTRAAELVRAVAARAGWLPHTTHGTHGGQGDVRFGRGFAYAVYLHGAFPGTAAAWSAWVADVAVNMSSGEVAVTRVTVGQDNGLTINPAGVRHQIHGNVIQATSRTLMEQVRFDATSVISREWGGYPILTFPDVPAIDVVLMPRQDQPALGAGESASIPGAAAIANAIYDATGVRLREVPFTPDRVLAALHPKPVRRKRGVWAALVAGAAGALGMAAALLPWRYAIAPVPRPDPGVFTAATIAHGRLVAAAGACEACHLPGFGGGRGIDTPFGRVWSANISPDGQAGIGAWSYPAFERAMRQGVSRDGHFLYPAHPYTAYARATDADLQALYAYVMAQPAVAVVPPPTRLTPPFNLRPLLAGWNALFLHGSPWQPDPAHTATWNRGAYLVEVLGHCGACHSPRNALGAERRGASLAGGSADGWDAPALTAASNAPVPWTRAALFAYLRTGAAQFHGPAAGPMATVVAGLAAVPDADIAAMATYLAQADTLPEAALAAAVPTSPATGEGARLYAGACAGCHEDGALPSLALNSNLHAARPANLVNVIRYGMAGVSQPELGDMPGFAASLNDEQVTELTRYLRARFAPGKPGWR